MSIHSDLVTSKIAPGQFSGKRDYLRTQQHTRDFLELTQNSRALRRLSAKRLGKGDILGRPARRSSFLGHLRLPFFRARPAHAFSQMRASFMRVDGKNSMAVGRNPLAVNASASSRHFSSPTIAIFSIC